MNAGENLDIPGRDWPNLPKEGFAPSVIQTESGKKLIFRFVVKDADHRDGGNAAIAVDLPANTKIDEAFVERFLPVLEKFREDNYELRGNSWYAKRKTGEMIPPDLSLVETKPITNESKTPSPATKAGRTTKTAATKGVEVENTPAGWAREWLKTKPKLDFDDVARETGMARKEVPKQLVGFTKGTLTVAKAAEAIRTFASEQQGVELNDSDVRSALNDLLMGGRKAPAQPTTKGDTSIEAAFPRRATNDPVRAIQPLPTLSKAENDQLATFLHERMPDMVTKNGQVAILNIKEMPGAIEAISTFLSPEIAEKVKDADLPSYLKANAAPTSSPTSQFLSIQDMKGTERTDAANQFIKEYGKAEYTRLSDLNKALDKGFRATVEKAGWKVIC
jgi:hypothetical protein